MGKAIKSLEAQLGVKLFMRTPQGIKPTQIAHELYQSYCTIVAEEDRIERLANAARGNEGEQVLLGRDSRMGDAIGYGVDAYCKSTGARIKLLLTRDSEEDQARTFVDNGYDYRFLSAELDPLPTLPREPLCKLHYIPVMNSLSDLASKPVISIEDLHGLTILTESLAYTPMRLLSKMCSERGFEPKLRAVEKTYIWDLLSDSTENVTFIRTNEVGKYPWTLDLYTVLSMEPALDTQIVLQTSHDKIDPELLRCIHESLKMRRFDEDPSL